ncbi:MAG: hypothetical protein HY540_02250 [Deltaproteobacteria bacterium]|nr:hypothetical protein [Deltaproteobacteria bacterium]
MSVTPFHLKLKKIDTTSEKLKSDLMNILSRLGQQRKLEKALSQALAEHLGSSSFKIEMMSELTGEEFCSRLSDPAIIAIAGVVPLTSKCFIDLDVATGLTMIERLLGNHEGSSWEKRRPTEIEQGVLQFLLVDIFSRIHQLEDSKEGLQLRFERFLFEGEKVRSYLDPLEKIFVVGIRLVIGKFHGFVRVGLPASFLEETLLSQEENYEASPSPERLLHYRHVRFPIWAEAGRTSVTSAEVANLDVGDVVVFEGENNLLTEKGVGGSVILRIGLGNEGGIVSEISLNGRTAHCRLIEEMKGV